MQGKYSNLSALKLREMFLNGNLDADSMELEDFGKLFGYETELGISEKNADVLVFCTRGMKRYEQYAEDVQLPPLEELFREFDRRNQQSESVPVKSVKLHRKVPRAAIIAAAIITTLLLATATAAAFGYNIVEMFWNAIKSPQNAATDTLSGNEMRWTEGTRFYGSFEELVETENLNILYPAELPNGYSFTDFRVNNFGEGQQVWVCGVNPFVEFNIYLGVTHEKIYDYQTNALMYNVFDIDGRYQAEWNFNNDFYMVAIDNEVALYEIIKNLSED